MKFNILFKFVNSPWGGGNQFLKALKDYFERTGRYQDKPSDADALLFNSHHCLKEVFNIKKQHPDKILIHRVDGPVYLVRGHDKELDQIIFKTNNLIADGTIFQSRWSMTQCHKQGMPESRYQTIIINAPDPKIFYPNKKNTLQNKKIKIIATSWSPNIKKGFDVYKFLDQGLNFSKYEMTFVGNSPITFKNIRTIQPLPSVELASILRNHDIYIIASQVDPCSNALIEALHSGLPAVARNSGGHPEIIKTCGELFNNEKDLLPAIDKVANNYKQYKTSINLPTLNEIGKAYYKFAEKIYADALSGNHCPKNITFLKNLTFKYKTIRLSVNDTKKGIFLYLKKCI